jgi:hypothetical protein
MGILDNFEQRLEQLVNGTFARAFKAEVQPVEVAGALQREMDDRAAVVTKGRTVVPNVFTIDLAAHDYERLMTYRAAMTSELAELVVSYSEEQQYGLLGPVEIDFTTDPELETGIFRVRSEAKAAITAMPAAPPETSTPYQAPPAPAASPAAWSKPVIANPASLVIAGNTYALTRPTNVLGRGTDVDIRIDDPGVSRRHVEIITAPSPMVRDLGSTNGTLLNGHRVAESALNDGDVLQIGTIEMQFRTG